MRPSDSTRAPDGAMRQRDDGGPLSPGLPAAGSQRRAGAGMAAQRDLCVSIHDVAPATWADCLRLHEAVRAVAPDLPLTWLLVPRFHGDAAASLAMDRALSQLLTEGHELALHGYTHLDTAAPRAGWRDHVLRRIYTQGEGEFAALGEEEALHRIDLGLAWFARRGWPVDGFVPPAWLASAGTRRALRQRPFIYTTSISRFFFLPDERSVWSPSLMYTARNRAGRCLSPPLTQAAALALALVGAPLVRLALHPADARHPALLRHAQHLIAHLLQQRRGITKRAFALSYLKGGTVGAETSGLAGPRMAPQLPVPMCDRGGCKIVGLTKAAVQHGDRPAGPVPQLSDAHGTVRATTGSAAACPGWHRGVRTNGDGHQMTVPLLLAPEISGTGTRCLSRCGTAAPANS